MNAYISQARRFNTQYRHTIAALTGHTPMLSKHSQTLHRPKHKHATLAFTKRSLVQISNLPFKSENSRLCGLLK